MDIFSTYSVKICHYNRIFLKTAELYRDAVDFFIGVCLAEWDHIGVLSGLKRNNAVEKLTVRTKKRPEVPYDFSKSFYKFPSYLRRSAIAEAVGKVSSYLSNLENWKADSRGKRPSLPKAGRIFPALYRDNTYVRLDERTARIKVYVRNTWDWLTVSLKKTDVDYIMRHCTDRKECIPTLQKRGKCWYLDFPFKEKVKLADRTLADRRILAVDLGINNACTCSLLKADGTVAERMFLHLPAEKDSLDTALNRIRKAQQHGAKNTPRLWARAKGISHDIAVKTAQYIADNAERLGADVIVFEHLDLRGKKRGRKKQKLHLWRAGEVQKMVEAKAHRKGIRISHVNAGNTSALAFDGSGAVERNVGGSYSICRFQNGKVYHCDLNASYNIGARYFIREILKSLPETERLAIWAKVPGCARRRTCTLSTLTDLAAVMAG